VLEFDGAALGKCDSREEAAALLARMAGQRHVLWSAAVIYQDNRPVWRHIAEARMRMRPLSGSYIEAYLDRNWESVHASVGCYHIEGEGIRLFDTIGSDYHAILGLPLLPILHYLTTRGVIEA
jgi:septum formation protein